MMLRFRSILGSLVALFLFVGIGAAQQTNNLNRNERAEIRFLQGMSDHHQMAQDMAQVCIEQAANAEVTAIGQAVIDAQSAESELMETLLLDLDTNN